MAKTPAAQRPVTILDVAETAGVSKSTVSLVLQGSPLIREETAAKVREVAASIGYVYNRRAAQLRNQSSNVIGVVINDLMNPFFAEVLVGIERRLAQDGFITFMAHTDESVELQSKVLHSMREQNAAGIVLCPALGTPASLVKEVQGWGIPLIVMVRPLGKGSYDYAGSDNASGAFMATKHLLDAGHRRVGFLGGQSGPVYDDRLAGYRDALKAHRMKAGRSGTHGTACLDLAFGANRRDILTGTPAPQAPGDFVALVDFLWPGQAHRLLPALGLRA